MLIRQGFVSNSSSSSFIIDFGKQIESPKDIELEQEPKGISSYDIVHMLYNYLWNGYAISLKDWCKKRFQGERNLYKSKDFLSNLIEEAKNKEDHYEERMLESLKDFDPSTTFVFNLGTESDFYEESFKLENNPWGRDISVVMPWIEKNEKQVLDMFKHVLVI